MEEKLLEVFKLVNLLNEKQSKVYAEIHYYANEWKRLEIIIRSKVDFSYIQKCEIQLTDTLLIKWDNIIKLLESYIRITINE